MRGTRSGFTPWEVRTAPAAPQSEVSVLGALLADRDAIPLTASKLDPGAFTAPVRRAVFEAAVSLYGRGEAIDPITLSDELGRSRAVPAEEALELLRGLIEQAPITGRLDFHVDRLVSTARLRRLIETAHLIIRDAYEDQSATIAQQLDRAEARLTRFRQTGHSGGLEMIRRLVELQMRRIEALADGSDLGFGVRTGFSRLDEMLNGLGEGDLCIVAARPSMGKTSWVLNVATNVALERGVHVGIFSLEMPKEQLGLRLLCSEARVSLSKLRGLDLSPEEHARLSQAAGHFNGANLWIDDTPTHDMAAMRSNARRLASQVRRTGGKLGLVIVDYLQLVAGENPRENRVNQVGKISRELKALARELDTSVIALSQLSRAVESRKDRRPILSDLRDSGNIEQDADCVLFLFRPSYYQRKDHVVAPADPTELIVAKQRNGPVGSVPMVFRAAYLRFDPVGR